MWFKCCPSLCKKHSNFLHSRRELDLPVAWWPVQKISTHTKNSLNMTATRAGHIQRALEMVPLNTYGHFLLLNLLPSSHSPSTTSQEFLALMCEHPHCEPRHSGLIPQWAQWTYGSGSFRQYCQHWGVSRLQRHTLPVGQRYLGHVKRCHWCFPFFW